MCEHDTCKSRILHPNTVAEAYARQHPNMSRRAFLRSSSVLTGLAAAYSMLPGWMPRLAFAPKYDQPSGDVLVAIFLRGGADALNMIVPYGEDRYYDMRPQLAIPRPDASAESRVLDLDGFFGLHPALSPLLPIFQTGDLVAVHATGAPHGSRSHFEAMDFMERGTLGATGITSGWIGRHLATLNNGNSSPVRAVGWGTAVQAMLRGPITPLAIRSIVDYHLNGDEQMAARMLASINELYSLPQAEELYASAQATRDAIDVVASVGYENYIPQNGATYPEDDFALALRQTAALIRAHVGLEAACIDLGGWDTHVNQGADEGTQPELLAQLAAGLAAFYQDMGADMSRVTVVVMSEFGRRVGENANRGTDHGHGGAMLVMNSDLNAAPVVADWPTLAPDALDRGEDLAITTDYRDVLGAIISGRLYNNALDEIFPDYTAQSLPLW